MNNPIIDLKSIIESSSLSKDIFASILFPDNRHPIAALDRVLKGHSYLNEKQISDLARLTSMDFNSLFTNSNWKEFNVAGLHIFKKGEYVVMLNLNTMQSQISHKDKEISSTILNHKSITLSEYLNFIDNIITKYENSNFIHS